MSKQRILVVDDEPEMLENLDRLLSGEGYECKTLDDPRRFRDVFTDWRPHVLITDLRMPDVGGMTLLTVARADDPSVPVIMITGYATVSSAVQAIQEGAFDYVAKPFTAEQLFVVVDRAIKFRGLVDENERLRDQVEHESGARMIGSSPPMVRLLSQIERVSRTSANVLITGESGTGKELVAAAVHEGSPRADARFVPVDCAALPEGLLESELFGHEKGSFTGAVARRKGLMVEADGGTLFLDEIGELTLPLQAKLLRTLEQGEVRPVGSSEIIEVDLRIIAATNRDLLAMTSEGQFREDLYYRLNVVNLVAPPLRERPSDIPLLVNRFINLVAADPEDLLILPDVWDVLESYSWPGNVRQLRNLVERLAALNTDGRVTVSDLPPEIRFSTPSPGMNPGATANDLSYSDAKERAIVDFHSRYLPVLLDANNGNVSRAAEAAEVSRRTMHRWLADLRRARSGAAS